MVPVSEENCESSDGGEYNSTIQYVSHRGTIIDGQPFNWKWHGETLIPCNIVHVQDECIPQTNAFCIIGCRQIHHMGANICRFCWAGLLLARLTYVLLGCGRLGQIRLGYIQVWLA